MIFASIFFLEKILKMGLLYGEPIFEHMSIAKQLILYV